MAKIIGLTGGIGSGKSTIAKYFKSKGIPVYIADTEAKKIMDTDLIIGKIVDTFGIEVLQEEKINRSKLSALVFNHPEKLEKLNQIIHPAVKSHFENWVKMHHQHSFLIKEAAILFESGSYKDCDKIILVTAPKDIRIERVMNRDGISKEDVEARMRNQWTDKQKIPFCDFIIQNISVEDALINADKIISTLKNP